MFGFRYFGWLFFGDSTDAGVTPPEPPTPAPLVTYETLVVPCQKRDCASDLTGDGISDFQLYSLQNPATQIPDPLPLVECTKRLCADISGIGPASDLTIYNIQNALFFNGTPLSFVVECPPGYYCRPGLFPMTFTYPTGTFIIPIPPPTQSSFPIVLSLQGCQGVVTVTLPAGSSQAAIKNASQLLISQVAAQQAKCDAKPFYSSPLPLEITFTDPADYICVGAAYSSSILATVQPNFLVTNTAAWAPIDFNIINQPSWMSASQTATTALLQGTPTAIGPVTFTLQAMAQTNNPNDPAAFGQKNYTINVVGITASSPLPNATSGAAYSQVLDASSIPGVLSWSVISGALPTWMNLNSTTGELYGTPAPADVGIIDNFTAQVTNGTATCSKVFDVKTVAADVLCAVFNNLVWLPPRTYGVGTASGTSAGNSISASTSQPGTVDCSATGGSIIFEGSVVVSEAMSCCISGTINGDYYSVDGAAAYSVISIQVDYNIYYNLLYEYISSTGTIQAFNFPFTIPAPGSVRITVMCDSGGAPGPASGYYPFDCSPMAPASSATYTVLIGSCP